MDKMKINIHDLLLCMSNAQDIMSPELSKHHQRVAYLAFQLAEQIDLPMEQQKDIFLAALVHDIGANSVNERLEIIENEQINVNNHAFRGAKLLEGFQPLNKVASIIKFHHIPWNNAEGCSYNGEEVPLASHIIHLADRTCAMLRSDKNVLTQLKRILSEIRQKSNTIYVPRLVDALFELSTKEYIWLDMISSSPVKMIHNRDLFHILSLEVDDIIDFALLFSEIIDFKSSFTAQHSAGVAKTAECIARLIGFSPYECKMMLIAGYLHDLGKIAIGNEILDKPDKLTEHEFSEIRSHSYYTYHLLESIPEFDIINTWASYHHEKLNGKGYPFHIKGENLSLGSRVMAVADIFTAITEDRPYRKRMDDNSAKQVLSNMVMSGEIDGKVVGVLQDNFKMINEIREQAQQQQTKRYENFIK